MIIELLFNNPLMYLMAAASITLALTFHEYSHAQMIDFLGDDTPRTMGRLSVNPLRHLDALGALFIFTVGFGWGKPVPFNFMNLRNKKWGPALVGLAGPLANFVSAVIVGLVLRFVEISNVGLINFFQIFVWINLLLGIFNLIPVPPLDGSHLLTAFMPKANSIAAITFLRGSFLSIILAIFFMMYVGVPFIVEPLFALITGIPLLI